MTSSGCIQALTAATQHCLGGSDCGRHRSGSAWPASWWFYRWHTGTPPELSWFCGGCSIGRLRRTHSSVVCKLGYWCSSYRRGGPLCRSSPYSGTCCLSAGRECELLVHHSRKEWHLINLKQIKTAGSSKISQKLPLAQAVPAASGTAGRHRVWSYRVGSASPSRSGGSYWWPGWRRLRRKFESRRSTLWSAQCSSGWNPNRRNSQFPPGERLKGHG